MKKTTLFKTVLLLCALIVGSSSAWATPQTYNYSSLPTTGWTKNGSSQTINSKSWTYSSSTYIGCDGSKIQIGSKNNPQTSAWTISIPVSSFGSGKAITNVTITAYTTAASATYDVSVGGNSYSSGSLTTSSSNYSTGNINVTTGNIVVTMTGSSTSKAMYLSNISVTYDDASTDPVINASNVNIDAEDTEGAISFSITNPVAETHLSATITTGGTWLSNATVDEVNGKVTFVTSVNSDTENDREGTIHLVYGDNLATKDITVTQAAMPLKYTVTYTTAQENGTLVIKNGEDVVTSGSSFAEGTILNIIMTPAENYAFRNWQYRRDGGTWITNTSTTTYTMTDKNVEFRANFDPTYPVNFSVNGQIASTSRFAEGKKITFPASVTTFGGYLFIGWAETDIDGSVAVKPTLVDTSNETMETIEKTYYAVFAKTTSVKATFDPNDITNTPKTDNELIWTDSNSGIELYLSSGQLYTGTPKTFTTNSGTSNYMEIRRDDALIRKVIVTTTATTYKPNKWVAYEKVEDTSGTTLTTSVSGSNPYTLLLTAPYESVCCFAQSSNQIRATIVEVEAELINNDYRTTLTQPVTIGVSKYASFCSASALDFSETAVKAYKAKYDSEMNVVVLTQVDEVPANEGVIIYGEAGDYDIPVIASADEVTDNEMVGVTTETSVVWNPSTDVYNYILQQGTFKKASESGGILRANRAYLSTSYDVSAVVPGARELVMVFDGEEGGTTGIANAKVNLNTNDNYFDLQGRKVVQPTKGLYIVNGKKVVIK